MAIRNLTGIIESNYVLDSGEYVVDGEFQVGSGFVLTVNPGAVIYARNSESKIIIAGDLVVVGNAENPVFFDGVELSFYNSKGSSIEYAIFSGDNGVSLNLNGVTPININNSVFYGWGNVIADTQGYQFVDIKNSSFFDNGIVFQGLRTSSANIAYNNFVNNESVFPYGYFFGDVNVVNNNFIGNNFIIKAPDIGYGYGSVSIDGSFIYHDNQDLNFLIVDGNDYVNLQKIDLNGLSGLQNDAGADFYLSFMVPASTSLIVTEDSDLNGSLRPIDVDGTGLIYTAVNHPTHGNLALNTNGSYTYTPAANFSGTDSFTFKANDGIADSNIAMVSITVNAVNDVIPGSGNDTLIGGNGVPIDGLAGTDIVNYSSNFSFITHNPNGTWTVGVDTLTNVERLQFADKKLALDLGATQNGGQAVKFIGALAYPLAKDAGTFGLILDFFDQGYTLSSISDLAVSSGLTASLAGSGSNADLAKLVFRNVVGVEADAAMTDMLVGFMDGRQASYTQGEFLAAVADLELNQEHVGLVGLQLTGLEYL